MDTTTAAAAAVECRQTSQLPISIWRDETLNQLVCSQLAATMIMTMVAAAAAATTLIVDHHHRWFGLRYIDSMTIAPGGGGWAIGLSHWPPVAMRASSKRPTLLTNNMATTTIA